MPDLTGRSSREAEYRRALTKLLESYGGRLLELLGDPPNFSNIPPEFWESEAAEMVRVLAPFGERVYLDAARQLINEVPVGVDWALVNERAIEWASRYTFELVRGINDTNRNLLQRAISAYFDQGQTIGQLEQRIMGAFGPVRAEMIAVTEITRAASEGEQQIAKELAQQGIRMVPVWQTNNDELVCPVCGPRHGKEITDGQFPPAHPRCVLPGNQIIIPGTIDAAAKSIYDGPAIEITIRNGRNITVTKNHPVLTSSGWESAGSINEGDYLFYAIKAERIAAAIDPHNQQAPAAIEDVFTALLETGFMSAVRVPASTEDFHGDGRGVDGYIDVIYPNRFLLDNVKAGEYQMACKHILDGSGVISSSLLSQRLTELVFERQGFASNGIVGSGDLSGSLFGGHSAPFDLLGFGLAPGLHSLPDKPSVESVPTDTSLARKLILRFPGEIAADPVIRVREFDFSGHVYDLQSNSYELYFCNSIITHNCRCWVNHELPKVTR